MAKKLRILIIECSKQSRPSLIDPFIKAGHNPVSDVVKTPRGLESALDRSEWDIAIKSTLSRGLSVCSILKTIHEKQEGLPLLLVVDRAEENRAIEAMSSGVCDYVFNDDLKRLVPVVEREIRIMNERRISKEAVAELRESASRYRLLVEAAQEGIWLIDNNAVTTFANESMARMLGYSQEDMVGRPLFAFMDEDWKARAGQYFEKRRQGVSEKHEFEFLRKNGEKLCALVSTAVLFDNDSFSGAMAVVVDITRQKQQEEELRKSREALAKAQEIAGLGNWELDMATEQIVWSDELFRIFGLKPQVPSYELARKTIHSEDRKCWEQTANAVMKGNDPLQEDFRIMRPDGEVRWTHHEVMIERDGQGRVTRLLGTIQDITASKELEESLSQVSTELQRIFNAARPMCVLDKDHRIKLINEAFTGLFGIRRDDAVGKPYNEVCLHRYSVPRKLLGGDIQQAEFETEMIDKDGNEIVCILNATPLKDTEGQIVGLVEFYTDITLLKQAEQALRESELILNETGRMARIGGWEHNLATGEATWTKALYEIIEISPEELPPGVEEHLNYCPPHDRKVLEEAYQGSVLDGQPFEIEVQCHTKTGRLFWCQVYGEPVIENGRCTKMRGTFRDIDRRKKAEMTLRERQHLLQAIMDNTPSGIVVKDTGGRYLMVNRYMGQVIGKREEEIVGSVPSEIYSPETAEQIEANDLEVVKTGKPLTVEEKLTQDDDRFFLTRKVPLFDHDGSVTGLCGLFTDISELKRVEKSLRESKQLLEATGRIARVGGWEMDAGTLEVRWTEETYRIHEMPQGYRPPLKDAIDFFHPSDRQRLAEAIKAALDNGQTFDLELRFVTAKGKQLWVRTNCRPQVENAKTVSLKGTIQDITDRKNAEEALLDATMRQREAVKAANVGLWDWDLLTNEVSYSAEWKSQIGYEEHEIGDEFEQWQCRVHPDDLATAMEKITDHIEGRLPEYRTEFRFRNKDGSYRWILSHGSVIRDGSGKAIRMLGSHIDITDLKEAEEELSRSHKELHKLSEHLQEIRELERKAISREIHDELGQLLTALKIDVMLLADDIPEMQQSLQQQTKSLLDLIDKSLVTVRRISSDLRPDIIEDLGLKYAAEWQVNQFIKRTKIECVLSIFEEDIEFDPNVEICVFRILQESLTNISRHSGATKVRVSLKKSKEKLELRVEDNGSGIPPEILESSRSVGLTGMKERAFHCGGKLEISSKVEKGTSIELTVPIQEKKTDA